MNMVYKDSKNAKIMKTFQQEVDTYASKIIHLEIITLSHMVKFGAQLGKAKDQKKFLKIFLSDFYT